MKTKHDPNRRELVCCGWIRGRTVVKLAIAPKFNREVRS